ncbi:MAG: tetratricopeptide repeat protein, partial [Sinobacteraceae bacterium]|nr:tetratricopeptide repeat protein [Nevskiaceae bacterium]
MNGELSLKPGRNSPCPCGSGQKYKVCCGRLLPQSEPQVQLVALVQLMHAGRFAELEARARALLSAYPHSGPAWQLLGVALSKQDRDACQALTEAVKYLPGDATAHLNLGNALGRAGRLEEAAASYRQALAIQPDFAEAHNNLGDVQAETGRLAEAAGSFRRAIELRPGLALAHQNLGKTLLRLGEYEEALHSCERAVRLAPESAEAHNSVGTALSRLGR